MKLPDCNITVKKATVAVGKQPSRYPKITHSFVQLLKTHQVSARGQRSQAKWVNLQKWGNPHTCPYRTWLENRAELSQRRKDTEPKTAADVKQLKEKTTDTCINQRKGKNCLQGRKIGNRQTHWKKILRTGMKVRKTELERGVNGDCGRLHFLTQHSSTMVAP